MPNCVFGPENSWKCVGKILAPYSRVTLAKNVITFRVRFNHKVKAHSPVLLKVNFRKRLK